ncbi:DoxX family protein [Sphingobacterium sp. lm-10]|uniref:DoxX family protein n=1 Tax=Sphingobacterium sp. lm-10 TaxID=2944904 RepID=UPI0020207D10|nr:DoxX family protein [Sphingobacterium sp. lm-10]MCL7989241.1 DoxX family protein [Sphingobacterium sp. lm-10]
MMENVKISFFFLRLPIAISLAGHGLVRLPKLQEFADGMVSNMEESILPSAAVLGFSYFIPIAEAIIGIVLLLGIQVRYTIFAGLALMALLTFGSSTIENWSAVESQLIHAGYLMLLFWYWSDKHGTTSHHAGVVSGFRTSESDRAD